MMQLRTALHLARAETRRARGTLLFCVLSVAIGAFAVTAIRSVTQSFQTSMAAQARQILGADLVLDSNQPLTGDAVARLTEELRAGGARVADSSRFYSMLARAPSSEDSGAASSAPVKATALVRVRAVGDGYPFYGAVDTTPAGAWGKLAAGPGVILDPATLRDLGLAPGARVKLGELEAEVLGEFVKKPGSPAAEFSLAPYLFIHQAQLSRTGLLKTGSRVSYERLFALPAGASADSLKDEHFKALLAENVELKTFRESAANVQRFLGRVSRFLTLVGLLTLFLGALGVGSAFHAFIRGKLDHAAILRCVGARPKDVLLVYGLLSLAIAAAGSALGAGLGALVPGAIQRSLALMGAGYLPAELQLRTSFAAIAHGFATGLWAALVFTLLPLSAVALVAPLRALRRDVSGLGKAPLYTRLIAGGAAALALGAVLGIAITETGSLSLGVWFTGAIVLAVLVLLALAALGTWLARRVSPRLMSYHVRQGVANLHRPGNQTRAVIVAVGAGFFLLSSILILKVSLERALSVETRSELPTLFAIDIQPDQEAGVRQLFAEHAASDLDVNPMISARLRAVDGRPIQRAQVERNAGQRTWEDRMRTREYFVTYREQPLPSEVVVAGRFWSGRPAQQEASIAAELAAALGIELGATLTLDVQGLPLDARVTSFRDIRWQAMRPNAMVVLSPGEIEQAPKMLVAAARVDDRDSRYRLQRELVGRYPNVSVVDVSEAAATVLLIISRVSVVFGVVGLLATATGAVILAGAISAGRYARQRESTLLRVLGASKPDLRRILVAEYGALALLGTLGGWLLAEAINRSLVPELFQTKVAMPYASLAVVALATVLLNTLVGILVGHRVSARPPLELLREA